MISAKIVFAFVVKVGGDFKTVTPSVVCATPNLLNATSGDVGSSSTFKIYMLPSIASYNSALVLGISIPVAPAPPNGNPSGPKFRPSPWSVFLLSPSKVPKLSSILLLLSLDFIPSGINSSIA